MLICTMFPMEYVPLCLFCPCEPIDSNVDLHSAPCGRHGNLYHCVLSLLNNQLKRIFSIYRWSQAPDWPTGGQVNSEPSLFFLRTNCLPQGDRHIRGCQSGYHESNGPPHGIRLYASIPGSKLHTHQFDRLRLQHELERGLHCYKPYDQIVRR